MAERRPPAPRLPRVPAQWLLMTVIVTALPHVRFQPPWLSGVCALLIVWQGLTLRFPRIKPPTPILVMFGIGMGIGVFAQFDYFFGQEPGVALLLGLLCLKQLESRTPRDISATLLLCFFLQMGLFFYDQSLLTALMALVGIVFALTTMTLLQYAPERPTANLRIAAKLILQGLPFMLALFLLFPRIEGPLWALPNDAAGKSGLSDSMEPGSISALIKSNEIAFRVDFAGETPSPQQRYWRGPVLSAFDGRTWQVVPANVARMPAYLPSGRRYDYSMTLEPQGQRWLLALDYPGADIEGALYASNYQLLARRPTQSRLRLAMNAYPETQPGADESQAVLQQALRLPRNANPRTTAMVRELVVGIDSPQRIVTAVLDDMRSRRLVYTLEPPLLGRESVDEFLFDTRAGFCEHFSSAFVFMMRRAGVPARVVLGYQGGEINPVDRTMVVRQSDAHAWGEVWLPERGWVRIDPTAVSAPERIEQGLAASLSLDRGLPFLMHPSMAWLQRFRFQWEALSNRWNQWVLAFDIDQQRNMLERLGIQQPDWRKLVLLLGAVLSGLTVLLLIWALFQRRREEPLDRAWRLFGDKLARKNLGRHPWEGPVDYVERAIAALPAHAEALRDIAATYTRLRYGQLKADDDAQVKILLRRIRELKLK